MFNWLTQALDFNTMTSRPTVKSKYVPRRSSLGLEELHSRDLPSAHILGSSFAGLASLRHNSTGINSVALHSNVNSASSSTTESNETNEANETTEGGCHHGSGSTTFSASLANSTGATGTASYSTSNKSVNIQVTGAAVSSTLDVQLDGVSIGSLATDASGNGTLKLKNLTNAVNAGSTLTVGDLTGSFTQVQFSTTLIGATGVSGSAKFNSSRNDFDLKVSGATASSTYSVLLDGVSIGSLTTNKSGSGRLDLDNSTLAIKVGSILTITDSTNATILTGTFA